jgi:hypothetical protein
MLVREIEMHARRALAARGDGGETGQWEGLLKG